MQQAMAAHVLPLRPTSTAIPRPVPRPLARDLEEINALPKPGAVRCVIPASACTPGTCRRRWQVPITIDNSHLSLLIIVGPTALGAHISQVAEHHTCSAIPPPIEDVLSGFHHDGDSFFCLANDFLVARKYGFDLDA